MKGKRDRFYQNNEKLKNTNNINNNNTSKSSSSSLSKDFVLRPIPIDLTSYKLKSRCSVDSHCSQKNGVVDMNDSLIHSSSNSKSNSKNNSSNNKLPQVNASSSSVIFSTQLNSEINGQKYFTSMGGSIESKNTEDSSNKCSSNSKTEKLVTEKNILGSIVSSNNEIDNFNMLDLEDTDMKEIPCGESLDLNNVNYLKEDDYIYDNSIRILKFIGEGAQAKIYLGLIEEIDKYVAIKRYSLPRYDKEVIDKISKENEIIKCLENEFILKYFDVDYTTEGENDVL